MSKNPANRPTYTTILDDPWLKEYEDIEVDMKTWVDKALAKRAAALTNSSDGNNSSSDERDR